MTLVRRPEPFSHPDRIFEVKFDGLRALAYVEDGRAASQGESRHELLSSGGAEAITQGRVVRWVA